MKPALVRKWIGNLLPAQDDSTTCTTTTSTSACSFRESSHSSTIPSLYLPPYNIRQLEELVTPSSSSGQVFRSALGHGRFQQEKTGSLQAPHGRFDAAKDHIFQAEDKQNETSVAQSQGPLLRSSPLGSRIEAESTRWTVDDFAIPSQLNLRLHDYESCDLLWLRPNLAGKKVTGSSHPFHHTHYDAAGASTRSLVIFIAAVCLPEEDRYFKLAGIGAFFNKHSILNISDSFNMTYQLETSRSGARGLVPHLAAAKSALQTVRTEIVPERIQAMREVALRYGWTEIDVQAVARFNLIVTTDCQALLDEISSWKSSNHLRRSLDVGESGTQDILVDLLNQIETLSKLGVQVVWSRVSERWNRPAKKLAADAVIGHCVRLEGRKQSRISELYC
ncbi:hypothetical protein E4T49_01799 [Aureobasidium sp. EXF-10728]|nr:hypothetical protein E4T49_01799 [Aureobasidium sp. EXF-10728]